MGIIYCEKDRTFTLQTKKIRHIRCRWIAMDFCYIYITGRKPMDVWTIF